MENLQVNKEQVNQSSQSQEQTNQNSTTPDNSIPETYQVEGIEVSKEEYDLLNKETGKTEEIKEETILPSDEIKFELPEKYANKTPEEIYKLMKTEEEYKASKEKEITEEVVEKDGIEKTEEKSEMTLESVAQDWLSTGEISEEADKFLEEKGFTKDQVEIYKEGLKSKADTEANTLLESIGTNMSEYQIVNEWMLENKSENEIIDYNKAISNADNNTLKFILKGVYNEYNQSTSNVKTEKVQVHAQSNQRETIKGYPTKSDYYKDMRDPRFGKDMVYTNAVEEKLAITETLRWY